ncbi:MAG: DUF4258 domain-containing protein [Chloroflexia bacterium]|nr:DUF4258 domain-containing protein [Chloroflexia bacterium]
MDAPAILKLLKHAVAERQVKISLHAVQEALAEEITRGEIESAMRDAQFLEDYPDWWLGPSCLILGRTERGRSLHLVVSYSGLPVTIITVYEPRPPKWITPIVRGGGKP